MRWLLDVVAVGIGTGLLAFSLLAISIWAHNKNE